MEREYDLFEQLADGSPMWRGHASGLREVQRQLHELTKISGMVEWLKANYPGVPILALNSPAILQLSGADYNLKLNRPETLLPTIASALGKHLSGTSVAG